jgi:hypothetical protein
MSNNDTEKHRKGLVARKIFEFAACGVAFGAAGASLDAPPEHRIHTAAVKRA